MWRGLVVVGLMSLACGGNGIAELFEAQKTLATADPGPAPERWEPDGVLHLSAPLVDEMLSAGVAMHGTYEGTKEVEGPLSSRGRVDYRMRVTGLDLDASDRCERCIAARIHVAGDVDYDVGPFRGATPVEVVASVDLRVDTVAADDWAWTVTLVPQGVNRVRVTLDGVAPAFQASLEREISQVAERRLAEHLEPTSFGPFGGEDLPLRAATVEVTERGTLRVEFLTRAPRSAPVGRSAGRVTRGWALDISQQTLLGLAAKESLEAGALSHDVVVEPTSLAFGRDDFTMGVRLWRPTRSGWWRDYTITGDMAIVGSDLRLGAAHVEEVGQSEGAIFADPLVAIGESVVLSTIESSVNTTIPTLQAFEGGGMSAQISVRTVSGEDGVLRMRGDMTLARVEEPPPMTRPRPTPAPGPASSRPAPSRPSPSRTRPRR